MRFDLAVKQLQLDSKNKVRAVDIARELGVNGSTLFRIVRSGANPSINNLAKIAAVFGVKTSEFIALAESFDE